MKREDWTALGCLIVLFILVAVVLMGLANIARG